MFSFLGLFAQNVLSITREERVQSPGREFICKDGLLTSNENYFDDFVQNYQQRCLTTVAPRQLKIHLNNVTAVINSHLRLITTG